MTERHLAFNGSGIIIVEGVFLFIRDHEIKGTAIQQLYMRVMKRDSFQRNVITFCGMILPIPRILFSRPITKYGEANVSLRETSTGKLQRLRSGSHFGIVNFDDELLTQNNARSGSPRLVPRLRSRTKKMRLVAGHLQLTSTGF